MQDIEKVLSDVHSSISSGEMTNLSPVLPFLFSLRGQPFSLVNHFLWEPMFSTVIPKSRTIKCGRQTGKSETTAVQMLTWTLLREFTNLLYVSPREEQTRTFSNDKVAPFIVESPIFVDRDPRLSMNTGQRVVRPGNNLYFSYALLDPERIRSKTAGAVFYDEAQDIDPSFLPVIDEVMSASPDLGVVQNTGTPKTFDNNLEANWSRSSQAEWCIPCHNCMKLNVAGTEFDLLDMIGPHGLCCAKCGKTINTRDGWWEHRYPNRRSRHEGYHAPQCVFPIHCEKQPDERADDVGRKWLDILYAQETLPTYRFYNEKLGESYDNADELISKKSLIDSSTMDHDNNRDAAIKLSRNRDLYLFISMGVDWGGGGESGISRTAIAILGWKGNGKPDVIYLERIVNPLPTDREALYIKKTANDFGVDVLADDYCGAGEAKEVILLQTGFPQNRLMPIAYVPAMAHKLMTFVPVSDLVARPYIKVPKTKSLIVMAALMNNGYYRFPRFESWDKYEYPNNLLSLVQEKRDRIGGAAAYIITHKANKADDLAHAINYASIGHWYITKNTPNFSELLGPEFTDETDHQPIG